MIRWPGHQANAAANFILKTKLHHSDIRALSLCEHYFATGSIDGEVIVWDVNSNVATRRFKCPKNMNGISEVLLERMIDQRLWAFVGTDDGIIHIFVQLETMNHKFVCLHSIKNEFNEPILGIRVFKGQCKRMIVADCQKMVKLWDIEKLNVENLSRHFLKSKLSSISDKTDYSNAFYLLLLKSWRPHKGNTTCLLHVDYYNVFATACDVGEIKLWNIDGQLIGKFGVSSWKLHENNFIGSQSDALHDILENSDDENIKNVDVDKPVRRKQSYFDTLNIYTPRFIRSVVTEGFSSRIFSRPQDQTSKKTRQNKSSFEIKLDRLIVCEKIYL